MVKASSKKGSPGTKSEQERTPEAEAAEAKQGGGGAIVLPWQGEAWSSWGRYVFFITLGGIVAGLHFTGWVPDGPLTMVLALAFAALLFGVSALHAAAQVQARWQRYAALAAGVLGALILIVPVWFQSYPGEVVSRGTLDDLGAAADVPRGDGSSYHVLVEGHLPSVGQQTAYVVQVTSGGQETSFGGNLSRTQSVSRSRRGLVTSTGETVHQANLHAFVLGGDGPFHLALNKLDPVIPVKLHFTIYSTVFAGTWLPWAALTLLLLCFVLDGLAARKGRKTWLTFAASALAVFQLWGLESIIPTNPISPLFGDILIASITAAIAGAPLTLLARKLLGGGPPAKAAAKAR